MYIITIYIYNHIYKRTIYIYMYEACSISCICFHGHIWVTKPRQILVVAHGSTWLEFSANSQSKKPLNLAKAMQTQS